MVARNPVSPRALKPMDIEKDKSKQKDDESPVRMTIEEIFMDYLGRRNGLRRALTTDWLDLYEQCDPDIDDALCLCGYPNETWDLDVPSGSLKALPPPCLGVNYDRDEKNWLYSVAQHSDVWLIGVALYLAAKSDFDRDMREKLFIKINKLTPLSETVREEAKKRSEEKTPQLESHIGLKRKSEEGPSAPKAKLLKPEQAKVKKKAKEKTLFEMVLGKIAKENQDSSGSTEKTNPDIPEV